MGSGASGFLSPAMFIILSLFAFTIFDCSVFVPSILPTMTKIIDILSHGRKNFNCEICGAVLEGIDIVQRASSDSGNNGKTIYNQTYIGSEIRAYNDLNHSLNSNYWHDSTPLTPEMQQYCINVLHSMLDIFETNNYNNNVIVAFVWQNQHFLCHYIVDRVGWNNHIFSRGVPGASGRQCPLLPKEVSNRMTQQFPVPSQVSRSTYSIQLHTYTWFLRYPVNALHKELCYQFCEGTLSLKKRVQLFVLKQLVVYNVHHLLFACRYVYPWFVRTTAILAFLFSQALGNYTPMSVYPSKSKDLYTLQSGHKDSASRNERNGISMKGPNATNQMNGNYGSGANFSYSLGNYYSARCGQTSKRRKR